VEAGYKKPEISNFRVDILAKKILGKYSKDFKEKNINIKFLINKVSVNGDIKLIERVLENLFSNAVSHVFQDGEIEINGIVEKDKVKVSVFNSGENIPEEKINDIWKAFFKVDKARTRKYGGTGLGLSIVKKILEMHSSDYGVKNFSNGVEFYFTLPLE
jgi:signal transduction histidine kinase